MRRQPITPGDTLEGLFVLPSEAGAGIGTALLAAIGPVTRLWVLAENKAARGFYERRDWQWSGAAEVSEFAGDVSKLLYVRRCRHEPGLTREPGSSPD
jgi:GNAT superfamily N-acetyltransferase